MSKRFLVSASALGVLALSAVAAAAPNDAILSGSTVAPHYGTWGFDVSGEDRAVKPGDDFFQYANGTYLAHTEIPADRTRFGNFDVLSVLSENRVRNILDEASKHPGASPEAQKIGAYYKAYMDEGRIERLGAAPLQPDLNRIRAARTHEDLAAVMGASHKGFGASIFGAGIMPDSKDPEHYTVFLRTGGLGLPDRDYYLDAKLGAKKAAYQAYVGRLLALSGWPDAEAQAKAIVDFETRIAGASWTRVQRRDRDKTYNPMTVAELQTFAPGFDWARFMQASDLGGVHRVVVSENTSFPKIAAVFAETPVSTLQAWEAFHVADEAAPLLSTPFVQAHFEFRSKTLAGQPELPKRWKRAVGATNRALGEAVGRIYVAKYFTPEAKRQMQQLVANLKTAFHGRIERVDWMSPKTKQQALTKLSQFSVKIGYPSKWKTYDFQVSPTDLYGDTERSRAWEWDYRVRRMNGPVDRAEWGMTPQTVNAYYNPTMNEIVFPAAILQPPFFDPKADPAINYGGIGGVIGHEMSHGFDDQGRKSDGKGRLTDWWTAEDASKFDERAKRLGLQYSSFEPVPGQHVNGQLTMGENIGDMGGINLALDAYHASLHGKPAPVIGGLTGDQRVFLGWAQVWRGKDRPDALRQQLLTDPHSPPEERVNAVVRNVDTWYTAFHVKPGDKLYLPPDQRVHIW
jgi:putative endopeptidase